MIGGPMMNELATKAVRKEVVASAPIEQVWEAWTTEPGVVTFFAPKAKIDLHPGGRYEMYFLVDAPAGSRGGEGCRVLELDAPERFVFSWNFPPAIPELRDVCWLSKSWTRQQLQ
jgi:uncharacterized protein YndB with AHSA1/START domain